MPEVRIVDTTIRDGQASLWAMNMRTRHMLPIMPHLDAAGFDSMEFLATGSRLKKFVRHLKENPWDWIRQGAAAAKHTQLRWHGPIDGRSMSGRVPPEVGELLVSKAVELGIDLTRTGNNWNDFSDMPRQLARFERLGMRAVINVMYSVSPRHTDQYFVEKTRQIAALRPYRLCFKDVGGLLTPERTRTLFPKMMAVSGDLEWEFHAHCNNGLGPLNAIEAAKAGARYIHTAVPPLANGNSQPSVFNVVANLRELGFDVPLDEERLAPVTQHLEHVADVEGFAKGVPYEYSERQYRHQIPGGMISSLEYQMKQAGVDGHMEAVFEETERVRADLGYPIMVTPLSQFVATQAAINVITGERYRQITDQVIEYALGWHGGQEALDAMDDDIRDMILDRPRAKEIAAQDREPPTLKELRRKYGPIPDEDLILRAIVGDDAVDVVGSADEPRVHLSSDRPLIQLLDELINRDRHRSVSIRRPGLSLTIERPEAAPASR